MKDDPESVALREEHVAASRTLSEISEAVEELEGYLSTRPRSIVLRLIVRYARWVERHAKVNEEDTRIAARKTYGR